MHFSDEKQDMGIMIPSTFSKLKPLVLLFKT